MTSGGYMFKRPVRSDPPVYSLIDHGWGWEVMGAVTSFYEDGTSHIFTNTCGIFSHRENAEAVLKLCEGLRP